VRKVFLFLLFPLFPFYTYNKNKEIKKRQKGHHVLYAEKEVKK